MSTEKKYLPCNHEVWGGIESTINRIDETYKDQLLSAGHYSRYSDIDRLAELGIKALRYPILWERHQPVREKIIDWKWATRQLDSIRSHNITPIAGLLHHGSGPAFTDLGSPAFAGEFARYAGKVAARFPWIEYYTPVNEPLTTARFSGLYGIWYPHQRDPLLFMKMLLHQVKGIVYAMKAIRDVNSAAKLIQTEDLAKVYSTPALSYQSDFENNRRWLTFDLLTGRVNRDHPLWDYLSFIGIEEAELNFFTENPCIPDIMGINYYVTSERFLDENVAGYPERTHGGNGKHVYADIEAVRVIAPGGLFPLLQETWNRYKIPIAITEAHLNCTREEQLRWLKEIWDITCRSKGTGIDIIAVTAWALFGASDWDSLLTRNDLHYEAGAYELKDNQLRLTGIGRLIKALAETGDCTHPLLKEPGWWHRQHREETTAPAVLSQLLLLSGTDDMSNQTVAKICRNRGISCRTLLYPDDNLCLQMDIKKDIQHYRAWGVIMTSGNVTWEEVLSSACQREGIPYLNLQGNRVTGFSEKQINRDIDLFIDTAMDYVLENAGVGSAKICME